MKIFLHIGMPKTGSTTIQRTLLLNQSRLAAEGVYYPYRSNFLYGLATGTEPGPRIAPPSNCHTLIISDERLFNRVRTRSDAELLLDALRKISPEIYVVSYLRRADEVFVSAYFTRLLGGATETLKELPLHPVPIFKRLSSWVKPLGRKNIVLRRFGRPYLPDGLVADFVKIVGIDHFPIAEAAAANWSPRCDVLEIIRLLNANRGDREVDRHALKAVARAGGFGDLVGLSEEKRGILIDKTSDGNSKLSKWYFGGERLFSHPVPDNEPHWPEIHIDDLVRVADRMAALHGVRIGRPPTDLQEGLEWIRALAVACARVPKNSLSGPATSASTDSSSQSDCAATEAIGKAAIG
jgi:hypothetical protein